MADDLDDVEPGLSGSLGHGFPLGGGELVGDAKDSAVALTHVTTPAPFILGPVGAGDVVHISGQRIEHVFRRKAFNLLKSCVNVS